MSNTEEFKELLRKIIKECTYEVNIKKGREGKARVKVTIEIDCPAPGEELLVLLT